MVKERIIADSSFTVLVDEKYYSYYMNDEDTLFKTFVCNVLIDENGAHSFLINGRKRNYLITKDSTYSFTTYDTTKVTAREMDIMRDIYWKEYVRLFYTPRFYFSRLFFGKPTISNINDSKTILELMKKDYSIKRDGFMRRQLWINTDQRVDSVYVLESIFGDDLDHSEFRFKYIPGPVDEKYVRKRDKILQLKREYSLFDVVLDVNE